MSASWPGNMSGPRVKTPLLLLLLLLLTTLTGTVLCQDEGGEETDAMETPDTVEEVEEIPDTEAPPMSSPSPTDGSDTGDEDSEGGGSGLEEPFIHPATTEDTNVTVMLPVDEGLSPIIILVPVVLVVVIIGTIVCCIFLKRRWNKKAESQDLRREDPYLDGPDTEKVPMPMFEEDVPSVMELEMEELDQWMKKDGEAEEPTQP